MNPTYLRPAAGGRAPVPVVDDQVPLWPCVAGVTCPSDPPTATSWLWQVWCACGYSSCHGTSDSAALALYNHLDSGPDAA